MREKEYRHGGERYDKEVSLDFSVNVNPLGMPEFVRKELCNPSRLADWETYPDADCRRLRELLAAEEGVCPEQILCGNGASELLYALAGMFRGKRGLLLTPCFTEYERAFAANDVEVLWQDRSLQEDRSLWEERLLGQIGSQKPELVLLCNPGNPMGELLSGELLEAVQSAVTGYGGVLVVDECFLTLTGREKEASLVSQALVCENLLVVKAFTKTYAIAGLRLGYLVGASKWIQEIGKKLPEWNVSAPAQLAGTCILEHVKERAIYIEETLSLLEQERRFLRKELSALGYQVWDSGANFLFFQAEEELYEQMLAQGILIRQCGNYRGLSRVDYRIAVRTHRENERLVEALKQRSKSRGANAWQKQR